MPFSLSWSVVKSRPVLHLRTNSESSETSDILYPLSTCSSLTYLLIFLVPILFIPAFLSVRTFPIIMQLLTMWFHIPHAPISCVDSTSCPYDRSSPRTPVPVPAPPLDSELLLYLNSLYLSIQTNLIISFIRSFVHSFIRISYSS